MDSAEPLIAKYNLENWKNPKYPGYDVDKMCRPLLQVSYRGLQRRDPAETAAILAERNPNLFDNDNEETIDD